MEHVGHEKEEGRVGHELDEEGHQVRSTELHAVRLSLQNVSMGMKRSYKD